MGLLRKKKDKRNKSNGKGEESLTKEDPMQTGSERNTAAANMSTDEVGKMDSGFSEPSYSEPYSPSAITANSSSFSGESKTFEETEKPMRGKDGKGPWFTSRQIRLFRKPPPAEEAAYAGPPRYDWVDIETAAAIKVQAAYRRRMVMSMMEEEGHTTAAVRNLARRRKAAKQATTNPAQDFVNIFNCCGVDLGLGGGNKEKYFDITRELESARYNESNREKAEREAKLRRNFQRKPPKDNLIENVEVVQ